MTSSPASPGFTGCMRLRIDHLEQEMVLPAVQPVARLMAFDRHARPDDLRQAVKIDRHDTEPRFEVTAHRVAPRLRAEDADRNRELADVDAHAFRDLGDVQRIGRRGAQDARAEILQQRHLPLGHAARHRHDRAAEPLRAVVHAEPAGEQAIAVGVVQDVARPRAGAGDAARHQVRPQVDVALGVADDRRLAGGAGGGVQPHGLLARHREQPERIGVAHVGLGGERKPRHVGERFQAVRLDARGVELGAHMRHLGIGALDGLLQARKLQRFEVRARHGFGGRIEHRSVWLVHMRSHPETAGAIVSTAKSTATRAQQR